MRREEKGKRNQGNDRRRKQETLIPKQQNKCIILFSFVDLWIKSE